MVRCTVALLLGLALANSGCDADFEDPNTVIDMRILGMRADMPEVLLPFDPDNPTDFDLTEVPDIEVCALIADPTENRGMTYTMTACPPRSDGRCRGDLVVDMGGGTVGDPDAPDGAVNMCSTLAAGGDLVVVIQDSIRADDLAGFGGVRVMIGLEVTPEGGSAEDTLFGFKRVTYAPQLPDERTPNQNPTLESITGIRQATGQRGLDFEVPLGRCGEIDPWLVAPGENVTLLPREPEGAREVYVVPTFEGGSRTFTENLRYQWHTSHGDFSRFNSGGELDGAGNAPPLDTRFRAPRDPEVIGDGLDVQIWMVQRDERGGQAWFHTCARVVP